MNEMYTIGKLSKTVNISTDTLRYYDEIGLLKPSYTDSDSGYRYYTLNQATTLNRIMELKDFGFTLGEIKELLADDHSMLTEVYRKRHSLLLLEKMRVAGILEKLVAKINQQETEDIMGKKVLLIDDAAFMRMMCKDGFTNAGYEVVGEAENGAAGVEVFKASKPDLVVLNIAMPVMDGIEALRQIKAEDPDAAVVMLSASSQRGIVIGALMHGARRFIVKPFNMDVLLQFSREAMGNPESFNKDTLQLLMSMETEPPNSTPLSQSSVDEIISIVQADYATAKKMAVQFKESYIDTTPAKPPQSVPDETQSLLRKIIEGQDEIKELLKMQVSK